MTSDPTADPAGVVPARPPRQQRGFITSYGVGRVCAEPGCRTTLSRYNKSDLCYPHADEFEARLHRERS
jgi:hypothetical protein